MQQLIDTYKTILAEVNDPAAAGMLVLAAALTDERDILTVEEVAGALRVKQRQVFKLIESGKMRAFRIGTRGLRVTRRDLLAFVDGGRA